MNLLKMYVTIHNPKIHVNRAVLFIFQEKIPKSLLLKTGLPTTTTGKSST